MTNQQVVCQGTSFLCMCLTERWETKLAVTSKIEMSSPTGADVAEVQLAVVGGRVWRRHAIDCLVAGEPPRPQLSFLPQLLRPASSFGAGTTIAACLYFTCSGTHDCKIVLIVGTSAFEDFRSLKEDISRSAPERVVGVARK